MSEELLDRIDSHLEYGDSRSQFVRNAIELQLAILDSMNEDMDDEERREFVLDAIQQAQRD
ncbi:hypothetical protein ACKVMT_10300 [Halobacteriales archaeon Cl-PHB]